MAIYKPGQKFRYHRLLSKKGTSRSVVALLSLTAMVDMFTVLVIFLLQNYNATGEVLYIPKEVTLPRAETIKELAPAVVVTLSNKEVLIDKDSIVSYQEVRAQQDWMIAPLYYRLKEALEESKQKAQRGLQNKLRKAVTENLGSQEEDPNAWRKITIQADKGIDFLTLKKVMYTVTEAGAGEINFAVMKQKEVE